MADAVTRASTVAAGDLTGGYCGIDTLRIMDEALNYNAFLQRLVASRVALGDRILDFGAGSGMMARPLADAGYDVRCVEPDPELRARLRTSGLEAHAAIGEIPAESVDLVYAINVLEHISDDREAIVRLRERLKPGGRLIVYVPAFPMLYTSMDRTVGHFRRYRREGLVELLQQAGLNIDHLAYQDSLGFVATLLYKLIDDDTGSINRRALITYDRYVFPISRQLDRCCSGWFGKNLFALAHR